KTFKDYQTVLSNILTSYSRNVLDANLDAIEIQWKHAQRSWFLRKWLQSRKIKKQLSVYRNTPFGNDSEVEQLFSYNNQLLEVQRLLQQSRFTPVQQALKNLFKDEHTDLSD